jgi:hypothetical protein
VASIDNQRRGYGGQNRRAGPQKSDKGEVSRASENDRRTAPPNQIANPRLGDSETNDQGERDGRTNKRKRLNYSLSRDGAIKCVACGAYRGNFSVVVYLANEPYPTQPGRGKTDL